MVELIKDFFNRELILDNRCPYFKEKLSVLLQAEGDPLTTPGAATGLDGT